MSIELSTPYDIDKYGVMAYTRGVKEILQKTRESRVKNFIGRWKFLSNSKYFSTNKVATAAWDSWAARGQAGGCQICGVKHHNMSFHNKRFTTTKGSKGRGWCWQEFGEVCSTCYVEIEKQCNYKFITY